ncbi:hypothetical protein TRVA0_078S00166 [Trichomonascus vanleenenianus]|uniref:Avl9p n=1 Tax=Trichomonascus vanleenenianus TaxID=2268995 RepID=UPI003EC9AE67
MTFADTEAAKESVTTANMASWDTKQDSDDEVLEYDLKSPVKEEIQYLDPEEIDESEFYSDIVKVTPASPRPGSLVVEGASEEIQELEIDKPVGMEEEHREIETSQGDDKKSEPVIDAVVDSLKKEESHEPTIDHIGQTHESADENEAESEDIESPQTYKVPNDQAITQDEVIAHDQVRPHEKVDPTEEAVIEKDLKEVEKDQPEESTTSSDDQGFESEEAYSELPPATTAAITSPVRPLQVDKKHSPPRDTMDDVLEQNKFRYEEEEMKDMSENTHESGEDDGPYKATPDYQFPPPGRETLTLKTDFSFGGYGENIETPVIQEAVPLSFGKGLGIDTIVASDGGQNEPHSDKGGVDITTSSVDEQYETVKSPGGDADISSASASPTSVITSPSQGIRKDNKVVSRLVSNFESSMQQQEDKSKPLQRSFSRSRAKMIGMSLMNGVTSPTQQSGPRFDNIASTSESDSTTSEGDTESQGSNRSRNSIQFNFSESSQPPPTAGRRRINGGHLRELSLSTSATTRVNLEDQQQQQQSPVERAKTGQLRELTLSRNNAEETQQRSIKTRIREITADPTKRLSGFFSRDRDEDSMFSPTNSAGSPEVPTEASIAELSISSPVSEVPVAVSPTDTIKPFRGEHVDLENQRREFETVHEEEEPATTPVGESPPPPPAKDYDYAEKDKIEEEDSSAGFMAQLKEDIEEEASRNEWEMSRLRRDETEDSIKSHLSDGKQPAPSFSLTPIELEDETLNDDSDSLIFGVCVVGFHHHRGPEVEYWVGPDGDKSNVWQFLPFQSLPDGSHSHEENFCYFTLLYDETTKIAPPLTPVRDKEGNVVEDPDFSNVTTLFGISCNRQVRVSEVKHVTSDITRSTVQKSVVVVARKPIFGPIKDKLAVVTRAFFQQGDFEDRKIIDNLYENLVQTFSHKIDESELNVAMPLRELVYRLRENVLVIFKALLLERKILFFASNTELLCASQFSLVSLVPNLINFLEDCGSPMLTKYENNMKTPTSLKTSDRNSLLAFMGLPLQIFAEGGMFSPYVPLQQIHELKAPESRFYMVGSTNSLLIAPGQNNDDIVVNMDTDSVIINNHDLKSALTLSSDDKKWMDAIVHSVTSTWDPEDPWKPKNLGFIGSEDYIRIQFEDYIMNLLSSVKYDQFITRRLGNIQSNVSPGMLVGRPNIQGNPIKLYNMDWVHEWMHSNNYRIFNRFTDPEIFDVVEPRHMASDPTVFDIQRQITDPTAARASTVPKETITKSVSRVFGSLWYGNGANSSSGSVSPEPKNASQVSQVQRGHKAGAQSTDQMSIAESIATTTSTTVSTETSNTSATEKKEGYFAGWTRWAATKRRQMGSKGSTADMGVVAPSPSSQSVKSVDLNDDK